MQPCRGTSAERHNRREKDLDYIRKDLSPSNSFKEWISVEEQLEKIKAEYKRVTGQKLQPNARPIQEIVLVIDKETTPDQIEKFCDLIKNLGMTPLSYAIHKDEGHEDPTTHQWIPNYHAHIIVDTTCWTDKIVERYKKVKRKVVINQDTGKPVKVKVNAYAKTIKFTRADLSRLQDYAAEATGLERGVPSDRKHEDARRYKAHEQAREIEEQAKIIQFQSELIAKQESTLRNCVSDLLELGKKVMSSFESHYKFLQEGDREPALTVLISRDILNEAFEQNLKEAPIQTILDRFTSIAESIRIVSCGAAVVAYDESVKVNLAIKAKQKVINDLTRQVKRLSFANSTKGALLAFFNRPANKQAEKLGATISKLRRRIATLEGDSLEKDKEVEAQARTIRFTNAEIERMDNRIKELESFIQQKDQTIQRQEDILKGKERVFRRIAEIVVDEASPDLLNRYESSNLPKLLGEHTWTSAKDSSKERKDVRNEEKRTPHNPGLNISGGIKPR